MFANVRVHVIDGRRELFFEQVKELAKATQLKAKFC